MNSLIALLSGIIFGLGLAASGMTNPEKVIAFLDITGEWQADLLLVMASALFVATSGFYFILKRDKPLLATHFSLPTAVNIDKRLVFGSALFGIGWGLLGYCPGPAIAAISYGQADTFIFIAAMLAGMFSITQLDKLIRT